MRRKSGYYWVKYHNEWKIFEFDSNYFGGVWYMCGSEEMFSEHEFESIGNELQNKELIKTRE